ncbi:hypothetical protein [Dyella japonica]|uniref:Uracil DNA glycosylase superfamily protein n=1 Tax=Dyella japonica TaxID=231455 RepID=A0ABV2JWP2_9GAMM
MDTLDTFESELVRQIGRPTELRPFVCDGSPLECKAFIVGFNPATNMGTDFWHFWRPNQGFDKSAWLEAYVADRRRRPLSHGKTRRPELSPSRRVMGWILEEASPISVLETNIYATPTRRKEDLASQDRNAEPFDFLLRTIKPTVILVHGKYAAARLRTRGMGAAVVIEKPHFSRGWSQASARELGREIKKICSNRP